MRRCRQRRPQTNSVHTERPCLRKRLWSQETQLPPPFCRVRQQAQEERTQPNRGRTTRPVEEVLSFRLYTGAWHLSASAACRSARGAHLRRAVLISCPPFATNVTASSGMKHSDVCSRVLLACSRARNIRRAPCSAAQSCSRTIHVEHLALRPTSRQGRVQRHLEELLESEITWRPPSPLSVSPLSLRGRSEEFSAPQTPSRFFPSLRSPGSHLRAARP